MNFAASDFAAPIRKWVRRGWSKIALQHVVAADAHEKLDRAYLLNDPWNMESDLERFRFEHTNAIIASQIGPVQSILEIGCGEGHQSEYLQRSCQSLHGIDVSEIAIGRARRRLPSAQFFVGDLLEQSWVGERARFDLVVACEVLYYIKNPRAYLESMTHLGKTCLVTVYAPRLYQLAPLLDSLPGVRKDWFGKREGQWVAAWWRNSVVICLLNDYSFSLPLLPMF